MKSEDEHMRSREDSGYKQGRSRRGGSHPGRVPDAVKKWKNERGKWHGILGITVAVGILLAGIAGLACVAVYRVRECQNNWKIPSIMADKSGSERKGALCRRVLILF